MAHLLKNPLQRDYIDFVAQQKQEDGNLWTEERKEHRGRFRTLQTHMESQAREEIELRRSLPPFKRGLEDVPVQIWENDWHLPEHTGEERRKMRLPVRASIFLKHLNPKLTKDELKAVTLLCGHRYNPISTELTLDAKSQYSREENEATVLQNFSFIIDEVKRLAKSQEMITWEEYEEKWQSSWKDGRDQHEIEEARFREEMLALPEHVRTTTNLYGTGSRMKKVSTYADTLYNCMGEVDDILQIEGPIETNSMGLYGDQLPSAHSLIENIDELPDDPRDYKDATFTPAFDKEPINSQPLQVEREGWEAEKEREIKIVRKTLRNSVPVFGLRSCLFSPRPSDTSGYENRRAIYAQPLATPLIGERLQQIGITPATDTQMFQLWKEQRVGRVVRRMFWGPEEKAKKADAKSSCL
eukprot:TRINITY_DN1876_c0_g1_i1.p1 TRINITY_DN1876_c0_g1~~TRINITY_DN1876_c0_g1_i1.p1  ORF type:complete len:459 (+),score=84.84 TRINITY_DN1876_c0_g1_i1:141-1379(+)